MIDDDIIIKDENGRKIEDNKRLSIAILASFGGSLIGLAFWVGIAALNFYSAWAALAIAWCAKYFYDKAKGPQTMAKFYTILIITIVVLCLSEYFSLYVQLLVNKVPNASLANTLPFVFNNFKYFAIDFILFIIFWVILCMVKCGVFLVRFLCFAAVGGLF